MMRGVREVKKMGQAVPVLVVLVFGLTGLAADISGTWSTSITLGGALNPTSTLTLNLGFADWEFSTTWTFAELSLSAASFDLRGGLGALGVAVGASFRPAHPIVSSFVGPDLAGISLSGWEFVGGYISLELSLGNFTLRVTFMEGGPEGEGR